MHRLGRRATRAGLTFLLLAIVAGVVLVHQTPQGPVLGKVVIDA
jgi:hypothetical protein